MKVIDSKSENNRVVCSTPTFKTMSLKFNWLAILAVVIGIAGCRETGAVTLDGNSYNVVVAISDDVKTVSDVQRAAFLQTVKVRASDLQMMARF